MLPKVVSLVSTVILIGWMFYFLCGGVPLLFLKHDVALDGQFVHRFFEVHYLGLMTVASIGAVSSALAGCGVVPAAIGGLALFAIVARFLIVGRMALLRGLMVAGDMPSIRTFRRLHLTGLVLNVLVLVGFIAFIFRASAQFQTCVDIPPG
jgi:hypothetical protein